MSEEYEIKFEFGGKVLKIKSILERVRKPQNDIPISRQAAETVGIMLLGFGLGILQKWMDGTSADALPAIIQQLDIGNYFGRLAIWILLATAISVYAASPLRAAVNTSFFFLCMLAGYYLFCHYVLGFLPRTYMIIWIAISFASFFLAYICWYAKGEGAIAVSISSLIVGVLLAQAISFTVIQGFYVYHIMEMFTWIVGIILLRRKPKEEAVVIGLSIVAALIYQLVIPHWG